MEDLGIVFIGRQHSGEPVLLLYILYSCMEYWQKSETTIAKILAVQIWWFGKGSPYVSNLVVVHV